VINATTFRSGTYQWFPFAIGGAGPQDPLIKSLRTPAPRCNPPQANPAIELPFDLSNLG